MNLVNRIRASLVERRLVVSACLERIKKAEREARKENRQVPRSEMDKLQAALRDARNSVYSAEASLLGAAKYPPLHLGAA